MSEQSNSAGTETPVHTGLVLEVEVPKGENIKCSIAELREMLIAGKIEPTRSVRVASDGTRKLTEDEQKWCAVNGTFMNSHIEIHELFAPVWAHVMHRAKIGSGCLGCLGMITVFTLIGLEIIGFPLVRKGLLTEAGSGLYIGAGFVGGMGILGTVLGAVYGLIHALGRRKLIPMLPPCGGEALRAIGTVKSYDVEKGFGFITPSGGGKDLLVHNTFIDSTEGDRTLTEGQTVTYELVQDVKMSKAMKVRVMR